MFSKNYKLLLFLGLVFGSCGKNLPPITSCVYDQPRTKFHCIDPKGNAFDVSYDDPKSDKLIAIPFQDFGTLLNYCKGLKAK
tara:strand:+ start:785 stop:1030 length:246 start_codon:yes stop_codon:yes gene_type:complete